MGFRHAQLLAERLLGAGGKGKEVSSSVSGRWSVCSAERKPAHLSGRARGQAGSQNSSVALAGSWTGLRQLPKEEQSLITYE